MPATFDSAYDQIFGLFTAEWDAETPAVTGGAAPEIFYQHLPDSGPQPSSDPWCRVSMQHATNAQSALDPDGGLKRFTVTGVVTVQVFVPIGGTGPQLLRQLSRVAKEVFQGRRTSDDSIWFRNSQIIEVGVDGPWLQNNVTAEFTYDEQILVG